MPFSTYAAPMQRTDRADMLMTRVRRDVGMWLRHGIEVTCWSIDPETRDLEIGVRTPPAEAEGPLRRAYGQGTRIRYADIQPGGSPSSV